MDRGRHYEQQSTLLLDVRNTSLSESQLNVLLALFERHKIDLDTLDAEQLESIHSLRIVEGYVEGEVQKFIDDTCGSRATVFSKAWVRSEFLAKESWYHDDWNCIYIISPEDIAHELYHFIEVKILRREMPDDEKKVRAAEERLIPQRILKDLLLVGGLTIAMVGLQDTQARLEAASAIVLLHRLLSVQYNAQKDKTLREYSRLESEINAEESRGV